MQTHEEAGARDFRRHLTRHLIAAEHGGKATVVTRNGHPAAALLPYKALVRLVADLRHHAAKGSSLDQQIAMLERLTTPKPEAPKDAALTP